MGTRKISWTAMGKRAGKAQRAAKASAAAEKARLYQKREEENTQRSLMKLRKMQPDAASLTRLDNEIERLVRMLEELDVYSNGDIITKKRTRLGRALKIIPESLNASRRAHKSQVYVILPPPPHEYPNPISQNTKQTDAQTSCPPLRRSTRLAQSDTQVDEDLTTSRAPIRSDGQGYFEHLRRWYKNTQSKDLAVRDWAQARLQIQCKLRGQREVRQDWLEYRGRYVVRDDGRDVEDIMEASERIEACDNTISNLQMALQLGLPNRLQLSAEWRQHPVTLEQLWLDRNFDIASDFIDGSQHVQQRKFKDTETDMSGQRSGSLSSRSSQSAGVNLRDTGGSSSSTQYAALEEQRQESHTPHHPEQLVATKSDSMAPRQALQPGGIILQDVAGSTAALVHESVTPESQHPPSLPGPDVCNAELLLEQQHMSIWNQHRVVMQRRFEAAGIPQSVLKTKLSVQEKAFYRQAEQERQVLRLEQAVRDDYGVRADSITDRGLTTNDFLESVVWELSSTQLWQYFENGDSWLQPNWIPEGHLCIETRHRQDIKTNIVLDLGNRSFEAEGVLFSNIVYGQYMDITATCHQGGDDVNLSLTFLPDGHVRVLFPALPLVRSDAGCCVMHLLDKRVEFSGVYITTSE
ncbi:hypothetical protein P153DRAFT_392629 [Dothidotthia symphoricarpi CBS 119687]|uniref:Uncharacterized protein n=1 Tax=Dothidotthia symphoricarpi CBS 119687 TaxID=1392245 RepID=A0A6A6AT31_9PLEO|nr:uncharacterized protein P153DRAFT_392629 [Dothidotthia symphoricarpi CBS 119687]KAF2134007.1 hypothetical protein P153DRAFT_392629 [Dothidotthia symphoricarpi CBS 119687]